MTTTTTTMQQRRDTAANWKSVNPTPKSGEICFETDTGKMKIGDGSTAFDSLPHFVDSDEFAFTKLADCIYDGVNLATKFASEIANYSDVWAWIKARIQANNYDGIHVGDYIPVALSAGTITDGSTSYAISAKTLNMQIAGIDTYYGYGFPTTVGHHIDFISTACIGTNIPYNPADNNNGTSTYPDPFKASKIYACLNGINNVSTGYNSVAHGYNASSGGVLQLLPSALQNVIVNKVIYAPTRYSASGLLTASTSADWTTWGKLWLPTDFEVYGSAINSGGGKDANGVDRAVCGTPVQYPLFVGSNSYRNNLNKNRVYWLLSSVAYGSSAHACGVNNNGGASAFGCTSINITAPVCFRVG